MQSLHHLVNGRVAFHHDNAVHGEDACVTRELTPTAALDAVLDGATTRGGRDASRFAAGALQDAHVESLNDLVTILERANEDLFRRGKGGVLLTTLSVALKIGDELHVLSIGDSPVYLIRRGEIVALTAMTKGPNPLGITRALGRHAKLAYTARHVTLQPHDRLALATDGISDNVAPAELAALMRCTSSPEAAVSALRDLLDAKRRCNRGRADDRSGFTRDDATVILRFFDHPPSPLSSPPTGEGGGEEDIFG